MFRLLQFLLLLAGAFLLFANIEPYIALTKLVFTDSNGVDVCDTLTVIPFLGRMFAWGCGLIAGTIYGLSGFIVWALFQIVELLPIANSFNIPFLSRLVHRFQDAPQVAEYYGDRDSVRRLKRRHNTVLERSLNALLTFSWVMYIVDLGLLGWLYSPLNEIGDLDWMALVRTLLGVFGVELVVLGLTLINNILDPKSIKFGSANTRPFREY